MKSDNPSQIAHEQVNGLETEVKKTNTETKPQVKMAVSNELVCRMRTAIVEAANSMDNKRIPAYLSCILSSVEATRELYHTSTKKSTQKAFTTALKKLPFWKHNISYCQHCKQDRIVILSDTGKICEACSNAAELEKLADANDATGDPPRPSSYQMVLLQLKRPAEEMTESETSHKKKAKTDAANELQTLETQQRMSDNED